MYSKVRISLMFTLTMAFLSIGYYDSHAQLSKLDEWNGYKFLRLGMEKSQINDVIIEQNGGTLFKIADSKMPELSYAFGDSVKSVYVEFDDRNKLKEIKIVYRLVESKLMDKDATNIFFGKVLNGLTAEFGKHTNDAIMIPPTLVTWKSKKVYLQYHITKSMGLWSRDVIITSRK